MYRAIQVYMKDHSDRWVYTYLPSSVLLECGEMC